jgi:hypothetical protein
MVLSFRSGGSWTVNMNLLLPMPVCLEPGEIMLYLDLHRIENMSVLDALKLAETLGLTPQLRYRLLDRDADQTMGLYALLHYEKRPFESVLEADYVTDSAFEALTNQIQPDTAVHFTYRLKHGRAGAESLAA